jgi:glutamyl-Q tRNA(Asp) synthetase
LHPYDKFAHKSQSPRAKKNQFMTSPSQPIFRFAPSPNGHLHLGHAYSALFTADWAAKTDGQFLLRIEDIDIARSKPEFVAAIFEDLKWLGLSWPEPVMHQSQRFDAYAAAINQLTQMGLLYPCFCSRADIAASATQKDPDGAPLYPGTCKSLDASQINKHLADGKKPAMRLNMDLTLGKTGMLTFTSAQPTPQDRPQVRYARPERWGDIVIKRKDTPTSYHLSVIVDDAAQKVTHVTRGRDLEAATDIHVLLQFLLGLPSPIYTHHRLILNDSALKLSKSKGAPALKALRDQGWSAKDVRTHLGF